MSLFEAYLQQIIEAEAGEKEYRYNASLVSDKKGTDVFIKPIKEYPDMDELYKGLQKDFGIKDPQKNIKLNFDTLGYSFSRFPEKAKETGNPIRLRVVRIVKR